MSTMTQTAPIQVPGMSPEDMAAAITARDARRMAHARTKLQAHGYALGQFGATPDDVVISKGRNHRQRCNGLDEIENFMRAELGSV